MHAFTECDSTSAFCGKGKRKAFQLLKMDVELCNTMQKVGESFDISPDLYNECRRFVCQLYGSEENYTMSELRYMLFCSKNAQSSQLPPSEDALRLHVQRANYQAALWKKAMSQEPIPSPSSHAWLLHDNTSSVQWMNKDAAPPALLQLTVCHCKTQCNTMRCSCKKVSLSCTDACGCLVNTCTNRELTVVCDEHSDDNIDD